MAAAGSGWRPIAPEWALRTLLTIDRALFDLLNPQTPGWLDPLFVFATGRVFPLLAAAAALLWLFPRRRLETLWLLAAGVLAVALSDSFGSRILKPWIDRTRPCYALPPGTFRQLVDAARVGSMPSLHAANAAAAAVVLSLADRRLAAPAWLVALLIALSRVYVGVHWPADLLGGLVLGLVAGSAGWWIVKSLRRGIERRRTARP